MSTFKKIIGMFAVVGLSLSVALPALAGPTDVTFTADTNVNLTGPNLVVTIGNGTKVQSYSVSATTITFNLVVGSNFLLKSTSFYTLNNDQNLSTLCGTNVYSFISYTATSTITVNVTPSSTAISCSANSGGGGGGGTYTPPPVTTPTPNYVPAPTTTAPGNVQFVQVPSRASFTALLRLGQTSGAAILSLQQFLNAQGFTIAKKGAGSPGHETKSLGSLTKKALQNFQKAHGLKPSGKIDTATKALLQSLGY